MFRPLAYESEPISSPKKKKRRKGQNDHEHHVHLFFSTVQLRLPNYGSNLSTPFLRYELTSHSAIFIWKNFNICAMVQGICPMIDIATDHYAAMVPPIKHRGMFSRLENLSFKVNNETNIKIVFTDQNKKEFTSSKFIWNGFTKSSNITGERPLILSSTSYQK